jgi:hypothetical protein
MVKRLLYNKEDQYTDYEIGYFEECLVYSRAAAATTIWNSNLALRKSKIRPRSEEWPASRR